MGFIVLNRTITRYVLLLLSIYIHSTMHLVFLIEFLRIQYIYYRSNTFGCCCFFFLLIASNFCFVFSCSSARESRLLVCAIVCPAPRRKERSITERSLKMLTFRYMFYIIQTGTVRLDTERGKKKKQEKSIPLRHFLENLLRTWHQILHVQGHICICRIIAASTIFILLRGESYASTYYVRHRRNNKKNKNAYINTLKHTHGEKKRHT